MFTYKQFKNMSKKDIEKFKEDPYEWFQKELKKAMNYDPLLLKCYQTFNSLHPEKDPFRSLEFFMLALYHALLANSINHQQLTDWLNNNTLPTLSKN